jgi:L-threonylcarbamoyladenylate synthase
MSANFGAQAPDIAAAVAALRAGELVAFPTETVYGLGADARNPEALRKVFTLKGRPADHPLILHLHSLDELERWVTAVPPMARQLAARFWPGPLTLVLPRAAGVSDVLTGGQDSLAVRIPAHPVARALLAAFGSGIAAPSANRYGRVSPTRAAHVREEFPATLLVLEGGDCEVGLESTIVSLLGETPQLLRPGAISRAALEAELGIAVAGAVERAAPRVPGSMLAHYAPQTPLRLLDRQHFVSELRLALAAAASAGERVAVWAQRPQPADLDQDLRAAVLQWNIAPSLAADYGRELYAALRRLDKSGASRILAESVPEGVEWDAARDRLLRAAATFL